ncbi:MAG: NAD(+) synthase [Lachnospiraceae bacterium]|nr:NAD(+) synthase [Lachnospiraceae bacterium]
MRDGFIKVAAFTPEIHVADPLYNATRICEQIDEGEKKRAKIMVFPELCITGYTCHDLFLQDKLLSEAMEALDVIVDHTDGVDALIFVGLPMRKDNSLYNVAAVINCGDLLGFVPKVNLPTYGEYYEGRHFAKGNREPSMVLWHEQEIPFGTNQLFCTDALPGLSVACEICEDLWVADPPSTAHAIAGANIIVNLSASNEVVGKADYRRMLVKATSARLLAGYIYASAGYGESTQDVVFSAHNMIAENGSMLAESRDFESGVIYSDIDVYRLLYERRRMNTFAPETQENYMIQQVAIIQEPLSLDRSFPRHPFVPADDAARDARCKEIFSIQSYGLRKRLDHIRAKKVVLGLSGGLDSTLALLVCVRAFDLLKLDRKGIVTVTMPCFGTTDRTYQNACNLAKSLGTDLREINIEAAVNQHFKDLDVDVSKKDVTYENCQARERTQVLMDLANKEGAIVVGTGDLSELALGWATYNGDHMSMYGVNAGVPKTLVRYLVRYYGDTCNDEALKKVLYDVLDTPVSPELLPPEEGHISQKTEDLVGPYELHDFFLYYMLRLGFSPSKVYRLALRAFADTYEEAVIMKWLKTFYRRFFAQQFKRSCLPDGPKVGSVSVSPRGDLRMPSDACVDAWLQELDELEEE